MSDEIMGGVAVAELGTAIIDDTGDVNERKPDIVISSKSEKKTVTETKGTPYELTSSQRRYLVFKRICDVVVSFLSLIVLALPFAIIAIIQKITSPKEPVFFKQERIGRNGTTISVTKFRSMRSTAPHYIPTGAMNNGEVYITKFGRFLRDTSMDELPQLFQVLTGKMSLIGPRPLIPQEENVHKMREEAGVYQLRPGMTGWAQVNGRDLVSDRQKVERDREYLEKCGLRFDFKIFCLTVKKVFTKEGIEEGTQVLQEQ